MTDAWAHTIVNTIVDHGVLSILYSTKMVLNKIHCCDACFVKIYSGASACSIADALLLL